MSHRRILISFIAVVLIQLCALPMFAISSRSDEKNREEWKLDSSFGFPVLIASNFVIDAPALSHRHIYMFIEAQDFTEQNIKRVFTKFAADFTKPHELWLYAYSDKAVIQKALDKARSGILCVAFGEGPEGRRGSRNYSIKTEPRKSGYHRAEYFRFSDGREEIEYSPNPEQEHVRVIDLKNSKPTYSGDLNKDLVDAAAQGDLEKVKSLLEQGADVNATGGYGNTALKMAAWRGNADIVKVLLEKGADVNLKDKYGYTALMSAAADGGKEIVQLLLDRGADINARTGSNGDSLDDTALMMAALQGHKEIVQTLAVRGAGIDERNRFGETALMQAAIAGFPEIVRLLLEFGADPHVQDTDGRTVLMLAYNDRDTVETLVEAGVDLKAKDKKGMTALMIAAKGFEEAKAKTLVEQGAGKESIEACKAYIAAAMKKEGDHANFEKEEGYRLLSEVYLKLGRKKEAVETRKQMLDVFGDKAHLRGQLGYMYLAVGDRNSAMEQYLILKERVVKARDRDTKRLYRSWADGLWKELKK